MEDLSLLKLKEDPILAFPEEVWETTCATERIQRIKDRLLQNEREIDI